MVILKGPITLDFSEFLELVPDQVTLHCLASGLNSYLSLWLELVYTLLNKYKKSLILVFVSSLLAQLFGLGIPLLIQQIIDKVLAQGNLSSLNVLGTVMIVLAVFQGCLTVLRTYIFVDTTDRMDLTL